MKSKNQLQCVEYSAHPISHLDTSQPIKNVVNQKISKDIFVDTYFIQLLCFQTYSKTFSHRISRLIRHNVPFRTRWDNLFHREFFDLDSICSFIPNEWDPNPREECNFIFLNAFSNLKRNWLKVANPRLLWKSRIQSAYEILSLKDGWDGPESKGFREETWKRLKDITESILEPFWENDLKLPVPWITPAPGGSFDIEWENEQFELLIYIPREKCERVSCYGEVPGNPEMEMEMVAADNILVGAVKKWLMDVLKNP